MNDDTLVEGPLSLPLTALELEDVRRLAFNEARRRSVSRETADDVAQVTLTLYDRFRASIRNAPAWVRTVVRRQVQRRRGERERQVFFETLLEEPAIDFLPELERRHLLDSILARLRPRDSALLRLVLGGYSQVEIARSL